jgi:hypothetical protein
MLKSMEFSLLSRAGAVYVSRAIFIVLCMSSASSGDPSRARSGIMALASRDSAETTLGFASN